jgi:hypothetical protein
MRDEEAIVLQEPKWKPSVHELAIMITLSVASLMVSLDATIVVTTIEVYIHTSNLGKLLILRVDYH